MPGLAPAVLAIPGEAAVAPVRPPASAHCAATAAGTGQLGIPPPYEVANLSLTIPDASLPFLRLTGKYGTAKLVRKKTREE
jgi:hypothetical protein